MKSMKFMDKLLDDAGVEWKPLGEVTTIKTGQLVNVTTHVPWFSPLRTAKALASTQRVLCPGSAGEWHFQSSKFKGPDQ